MKKIQKVIFRTEKRVVSLLLAMLFILTAIFSSMSLAGYQYVFAEDGDDNNNGNPSIEAGGEQLIIRDDALHFIFRHWHTNWDPEATLQSSGDAVRRDQYDADTKRYFVMVEGYIIPHNDSEMKGKVPENKYTIVLVNQATGELVQASTLYNDYQASYVDNEEWIQAHGGEIKLSDSTTPYLGTMNKTTGSIELKVKKLTDVYTDENGEHSEDTEKFCGISLSAGRGASTLLDMNNDGENDIIRIQYSTDVPTHIVKGHIFYSSWTKVVTGTNDPKIIEGTDAEVDTAEVYTWNEDGETPYEHEAGDVVMYDEVNGEYTPAKDGAYVLKKGDDKALAKLKLKVGPTEGGGDIQLTTFYSSYKGLHTNKTLVTGADGRYFLFDLEAWYIEGYAAQLGYVIDASGSMAGTSDVPSILNIYVAIASRLGVRFEESTGLWKYTHNDPEVDPPIHTHTLKTCSLPYYEVRDNTRTTYIVRETEIKANGAKLDRTKIEDIALGAATGSDEVPEGSHEYIPFEEEYTVLNQIKSKSGTVTTLTGAQISTQNLTLVSTYYAPSDAEQRIDMQKFLVAGDRYTPSTSKHEGYCWAGLVKEFGKAELCETISNTIGDKYLFTESDWDAISGLKGFAANIGNTKNYYKYPQRANLIGYYEITNQSSGGYRRWYYNSIDVAETNGIHQYNAPVNDYTQYADLDYFAQAVVQGESEEAGGVFDFSVGKTIRQSSDFNGLGTISGIGESDWGKPPVKFDATYGLNLGGSTNGGTGFKLSAASTPKGNFTLSFNVQWYANWVGGKDAEILYIGKSAGNIDEAEFRLVREKNGDLVLYYGNDSVVLKANYTSTSIQTFTFNYQKETGTLGFFVNGVFEKSVTGVKISDNYVIVFDPFDDGVASADNKFYVDEIFVYSAQLSMTDVAQLYSVRTTKPDNVTTSGPIKWDDVFLNVHLLNLFLNPNNTAHVPLGVAAYNYYVFDGEGEFYPLAYWEGQKTKTAKNQSNANATFAVMTESGTVLGQLRNNYVSSISKAGWYYLSHHSDNTILMNVGTAKALTALVKDSFKDEVLMNSEFVKSGADTANTPNSYDSTQGQTIPFYIDANGNLRCFFSTGIDNAKCSYVYEQDDSKYVKTEALQRILAYFSAELSEKSPSSQISAVQFSNANRNLDDLVLLDWSSSPDDIAAILSQKFAPGDATGSNEKMDSEGNTIITEHNFSLTGGTATNTGLRSFFENVVTKGMTITYDKKEDQITYKDARGNSITLETIKANPSVYRRDLEDAPKFVIIFTDGADDNYYKNGLKDKDNPAYMYAKALKELDYTVIGMYLPAGSDPRDAGGNLSEDKGTVYAQARDFLGSIVSADDSGPYVYASTDLASVADIFDRKIMESINGIMSGYTVQEYIDPRFDLQTADGTVWHLGAEGKVTIESAKIETGTDTDGKPTYTKVTLENSYGDTWSYDADGGFHALPWDWKLTDSFGVIFHLSGANTAGAARDASLRYDSDNDMYYLIWEDQTIQSSPVGSTTMMPVWSVEYWLVAKADFIGGNAVLSSGNEENMNYVYHPADVNEKAYAKYAFDSWLALSASLRSDYDNRWAEIWDDGKGNKAASYDTYLNMWRQLTTAEQDAMVEQWNLKYGTGYVRGDFDGYGVDENANGARIMFMIVQMNLKRTNVYDASSGTGDMIKDDPNDETEDKILLTDEKGNVIYDPTDETQPIYVIDQFPSKGIPRIAVNVSPDSVYETDLVAIMYLGEIMSPVLVLNNMVNNNPTNWYLNYLARYAYYLYKDAGTPLLNLLMQWNDIGATNNVKSFSVPYMYLPNYQYDVMGEFINNKLNSAGVPGEHSEDVLGLLTYHWTRIQGEGSIETSVVNERNMNPWERMEYNLTVEFTAFRVGDSFKSIDEELKALEGDRVEIFNAALIAKDDKQFDELEYDRIKYLTSGLKTDEEGSKAWQGLVSEKEAYKDKDGNVQERLAYQPTVWSAGTKDVTDEADAGSSEGSSEGTNTVDKNKVTIAALMRYMEVSEEEAEDIVKERKDEFFNNGRTQQSMFHYQPNVVGGELAFELKIKASEEEWKSLELSKTITVTATRTFADNALAEELKGRLPDYEEKFTITFAVSKSNASPVDGIYTLYAKAASITGTFDGESVNNLTALPIGNYTFGQGAVNTSNIPRLKVSSFGFENDVNKFDASYFVKNQELFGTKENPNDVTDNIAYYSGNTIYFGTKMNNISNYKTRSSDGEAWIRDHDSRIAIIDVSAGVSPDDFAKIVIVEQGGESNESFLYRVSNQETEESIVVSVKGGGHTTIFVPRGTYTVTEISNWSWKYYSGAVIEASVDGIVEWRTDDDGTLQEPENGYWQITQNTASYVADVATITFGNSVSRAVVTYRHKPNYKGWLGGENYADFFFGDSHE